MDNGITLQGARLIESALNHGLNFTAREAATALRMWLTGSVDAAETIAHFDRLGDAVVASTNWPLAV
jgi:hypothetical protein